MTATATIAGLRLRAVDPAKVRPNPWNPNRMDEETFAKELESIRQHGFVDPITIRVAPDGADEIVDGENRWKAAKHLKLPAIPATDLGALPDQQAKKLTIIYNELRGKAAPELLAKLVADLGAAEPVDELAAVLPFSAAELDTLRQAGAAFDWDAASALNATPASDAAAAAGGANASTPVRTGAEERRFVLGGIQGTVPVALADALAGEFNRSSAAVGSKTPEVVLADWARRLKKTPPVARAQAKPKAAAKKLAAAKKGKADADH